MHIGSFIAVLVFFRNEILNFTKNKILFFKIIVGSLPVILIGYLLIKLELINHLRNIKVIGWTTLIFGLLLFWGDRFSTVNKLDNDLNFKSILFIGFMQVLALIPGTSRSGISLTSARFLKFNRVDSAKISFLLSIPTLGAVSVFGIGSLIIDKNFDLSF